MVNGIPFLLILQILLKANLVRYIILSWDSEKNILSSPAVMIVQPNRNCLNRWKTRTDPSRKSLVTGILMNRMNMIQSTITGIMTGMKGKILVQIRIMVAIEVFQEIFLLLTLALLQSLVRKNQ